MKSAFCIAYDIYIFYNFNTSRYSMQHWHVKEISKYGEEKLAL